MQGKIQATRGVPRQKLHMQINSELIAWIDERANESRMTRTAWLEGFLATCRNLFAQFEADDQDGLFTASMATYLERTIDKAVREAIKNETLQSLAPRPVSATARHVDTRESASTRRTTTRSCD